MRPCFAVVIVIVATLLVLKTNAHIVPRQQPACENSPTARHCWGQYNLSTDYYNVVPDTGVVREYWLSVENSTLAPDGYQRQVLAVNGTLPGPAITGDWGDHFVIHVTNKLENNGTAIHWHGIRNLNTNQYDGVPGVTQCPIAPGETMTYQFRATQYGTSWYHSHFSAQMVDGMYGPIVIHGPASANYDVDVGSIFLADWAHVPSCVLWETAWKFGRLIVASPVVASGLINGMNAYPCNTTADAACLGTGRRFELRFQREKQYLLRLVSPVADGWMTFSIDNHDFLVIANDLVPLVPYRTNNLIITSGQRYDIVVEANQEIDNYWMRATPQIKACDTGFNYKPDNIRGIIRYEDTDGSDNSSDATADPTSAPWPLTPTCGDEPYNALVPYLAKNVEKGISETWLRVGWYFQWKNIFHWTLGTRDLVIDWKNPTNRIITQGYSIFPSEYNIYEVPLRNQWTYWIIQDESVVNAWHPFHLHGHDFYLLAQGKGHYNPLNVRLNLWNPPRRDTATMAGGGYIIIAFLSDNPGSWLFHCHIAWHSSQGLSLQFVERQSEILGIVNSTDDQFDRICDSWNAYADTAQYGQVDSGI
ncbi:multicopper oxidase-domain-containing protein [Aspergillus pseudoustus]|uniref:Multicopper oxidase-domain-containing protein n=1 Tax=Aspergillus pseudoustus TaxID=1810923 RepID=A0ABR4IHV4_9EURO